MEFQIDDRCCWQGSIKDIHMGCCLEMSQLERDGLGIRYLKQVHGAEIIGDRRFEICGQTADGMVTDRGNLALVIRTADCVPLHVTDGKRIALIHAGWRGTEAGIVKAIANFFKPEHVQVVIGPAISAANYEVDDDLYGNWVRKEPEVEEWLLETPRGGTKRRFNLKGLVRAQLLAMGVSDSRITLIPICTYQSPLPSYRRQGQEASRILNYIYREKVL